MSKSYKKAIVKDSNSHRKYHRTVRGSQKNFMRSNIDKIISGEVVIPEDKTIVNDYDYCDYRFDLEHDPGEDLERIKKFRRK